MKQIRNLLFPVALAYAAAHLTGCVAVPKTTITGSIAGQPFAISSPKDSTLNGLLITANTNGVSVKIDSLTAKMNPDIITTTAAGQKAMIDAIFTGAISLIQNAPK